MSSFRSSLFGRAAKAGELQPDTATSLAAARALALAGSGPDWWPYVVLVTPAMMAVHVAGAAAPAPAAPWRIGPDPRVWTVSRADAQSALEGGQALADLLEAATYPRPILLGRFTDGFVYLDMARAPGTLAVRGTEPWAGRVRELLIAQLADATQVRDGEEGLSGAHWPIEVDEHGRISVLGVAMAVAIKSPERLDLPIAPTRQAVLREMTTAARQAMPPEDAAVMPANAAPRTATAAAPATGAAGAPAAAPAASNPARPTEPELKTARLPNPARAAASDSKTRPMPNPARSTDAESKTVRLPNPARPAEPDPRTRTSANPATSTGSDVPVKRPDDPAGPRMRRQSAPTPATAAPAASATPAASAGPAPAVPATPVRAVPATPVRGVPATPAPAAPATRGPAAPTTPVPAASGGPAAARGSQRHLPAELYDAPAISAAAPAAAPIPAQQPGSGTAPPRRPQPTAQPPAATSVEWNDVAVSSAEED